MKRIGWIVLGVVVGVAGSFLMGAKPGELPPITVNLDGTERPSKLTTVNDNELAYDSIFARYSNRTAVHHADARANGSMAKPQPLVQSDLVSSFQSFGWDGKTFEHGASLNVEVDGPVTSDRMPSGFAFKTRGVKEPVVGTALQIRSNKTTNNWGRIAYDQTAVGTHGMNSDKSDYDADDVLREGTPDGVWRLQAHTSDRTISGILCPQGPSAKDGHFLTIINVGTNKISILNEGAASQPQNRVITGTGATMVLAENQNVTLFYDTFTQRWRALQ
jgi:hypothetical protein